MNEYEVLVETINPCGGEAHAIREFREIETQSPEAYVKAEGRFPIMETVEKADGDILIVTGDGKGNFVRYTFTA